MKKVAVLLFIMAGFILTGCVNININTTQTESSKPGTTIEDLSLPISENEKFAQEIAEEFSTEEIKYYVYSVDDVSASLLSRDTDYSDIHIEFSEYGNQINLSFATDKIDDEYYRVLEHVLTLKLLDIPVDDQKDILSQYASGKIDYNGKVSIIGITDEHVKVIGIKM